MWLLRSCLILSLWWMATQTKFDVQKWDNIPRTETRILTSHTNKPLHLISECLSVEVEQSGTPFSTGCCSVISTLFQSVVMYHMWPCAKVVEVCIWSIPSCDTRHLNELTYNSQTFKLTFRRLQIIHMDYQQNWLDFTFMIRYDVAINTSAARTPTIWVLLSRQNI